MPNTNMSHMLPMLLNNVETKDCTPFQLFKLTLSQIWT